MAKTGVVSAHGALILLREPVNAGQNLTLRNILTSEEAACTVAESNPGVAEVGVHSVHPSPRFWRVAFPPSASSLRSPEAKRFNTQNANPAQNQEIRSRIPSAAPARPARPLGRESV
jgi:hypothetical protein